MRREYVVDNSDITSDSMTGEYVREAKGWLGHI